MSIVLPVGMLTAFKTTGLMQEPLTIYETFTKPITASSFQRPEQHTNINQWINSSFNNEEIVATDDLFLIHFIRNAQGWPADGNNYMSIAVAVDIANASGYVYSVSLFFSTDASSFLILETSEGSYSLANLKVNNLDQLGWPEKEILINANAISENTSASLTWLLYFMFSDAATLSQLLVSTSIVYFNGTTYNRLNIPMKLEVLAP